VLRYVISPVRSDAWIDGQGRFRRFAFRAKVRLFGSTRDVAFSIGFGQYGVGVDVARPSPSDVEGDLPPFGAS